MGQIKQYAIKIGRTYEGCLNPDNYPNTGIVSARTLYITHEGFSYFYCLNAPRNTLGLFR